MGRSTDQRNDEKFMLAINDVFGPPATVKNELFARARKLIGTNLMPLDIDYWLKKNLQELGYHECFKGKSGKFYEPLTGGHYKIVSSQEYCLWTDGHYKIE